MACRASFLSVGIWWALFSIPLFLYVPEPPADRTFAGINPISAGFLRLRDTFREVRRYREAMKFLMAFWLYNDGIGTIITMATIYGSEIGIGQKELVGALLMTQFVGIPFTLLLGRIAGVIGAKRTVIISLIIYAFISIGGYFMSKAWHFFSLAFAVGIVQGGSQALSRSIFGRMIPKAKSAEFFGFYDISSKFSGIFGPAIFALVGHISGSSRASIVSLLFFFLGGAFLLSTVRIPENVDQ
jgi:UMF1 family MFS transporter